MNSLIKRITHWEAWPFKLLYAPMAPFWFFYMIRSRAVWFFTPSNPKLTFGGMEGEPKKEMYNLLPTHLYPATINILPGEPFSEVLQKIGKAGIRFPLIVKPEVGGQGILFRKLDEPSELEYYHQRVPVEYIVQELVSYPMEVSVFYIRHPKEKNGRITGFLHKIPMQVQGDGRHTLEELILRHPKASKRLGELHSKHKENWHKVLPAGQKYMLSYAANHNRGAHFVDLKDHIDECLLSVFDEISHSINDFFYGRYDIMCRDIESLKQGRDFSILEFNGCGAEPNHFYDTGYTLLGAYREILAHWKALYDISRFNAQQGIKPWPFLKGMRFLNEAKDQQTRLKEIDAALG